MPGGGGEVSRNLNDGDDRMGAKIKTSKNPQGFQQNPNKYLDKNLPPTPKQQITLCRMPTSDFFENEKNPA